MQLLDELGQEHRLVDEVAGSLVRFSQRAAEGDIEPSDAADFVRFFRVFVAGFHHQREEETLFPALVDRAEVPKDRGPLPAIAADHREAVLFVDALEAASRDPKRAAEVARRFANHLWEHVDKEESVLLPEARERLRRNGLTRLEGREPTDEEQAARKVGEQLTERINPLVINHSNQVWARVAVLNENRHTKTDTSLATTTV